MDKNLKEMLIKEAEKLGLKIVYREEHFKNYSKDIDFMKFDLKDISRSWETRTKGESFYFRDDEGSYSLDFLIRNRIIL